VVGKVGKSVGNPGNEVTEAPLAPELISSLSPPGTGSSRFVPLGFLTEIDAVRGPEEDDKDIGDTVPVLGVVEIASVSSVESVVCLLR